MNNLYWSEDCTFMMVVMNISSALYYRCLNLESYEPLLRTYQFQSFVYVVTYLLFTIACIYTIISYTVFHTLINQ